MVRRASYLNYGRVYIELVFKEQLIFSGGKVPLNIEKSVIILKKNTLMCPSVGEISHLKCSLKSI